MKDVFRKAAYLSGCCEVIRNFIICCEDDAKARKFALCACFSTYYSLSVGGHPEICRGKACGLTVKVLPDTSSVERFDGAKGRCILIVPKEPP